MADSPIDIEAINETLRQQSKTLSPTPSSVQKFTKEQENQIKSITNQTKVGKVEEVVGEKLQGAIEKGQKGNIVVRTGTNFAVSAMNIANKVITPITQGISTGLLTPQALAQGKGLNSFSYARKKSKDISMGQAVATSLGQVAGAILPDTLTPTFMDEDFNVFDDEQRNKAFKDEWLGIITSGATDIVIAALGSKGAGAATRAGTKKVIGTGRVKSPVERKAFNDNVTTAVMWGMSKDGSSAPNGLAVLLDDAVKETDTTKLLANPLITETSNPNRTATIISRLDNHADVGDYLKATYGDAEAFQRFLQRKPLEADHLDDYGINNYNPISSWDNIAKEHMTPDLTDRYKRIVDAKTKGDKSFASALEDFASKIGEGVREEYLPGRAAYENFNLTRKKIALQAKFGDLKLFGKDENNGWRSTVYQSNPYDRVIRVIGWAGSGRPQGHINISNPRPMETEIDLLSDLNRLSFLRGAEGTQFKRDMLAIYKNAQTDTQRALAIARIEEKTFIRLGRHYGVHELQGIADPKLSVENTNIARVVTEWVSGKNAQRTTSKKYLEDNGFIPDEQGAINVVKGITSLSTEANNIPMLDFRKLENEIILHMKKELPVAVTTGQYVGAQASRAMMTMGQYFDVANMVFSNLNLLRIGYIPKNSMVDPFMRASMALESTELIGNAIPSLRNALYNNSIRAENFARYIPGTGSSRARRQEQAILNNIKTISRDKKLPMQIAAWKKSQASHIKAEKEWQDALDKQKKAIAAEKAASKNTKAQATDARQQADELVFEKQKTFNEIDLELTRNTSIVQGIASVIEKERARIAPSIIKRGDKKQLRTLGQVTEEWEVDGEIYTIKGIADPNQRGSAAYMTEVDTLENFYATATRSEINNRVRAQGRQFVNHKLSDGDTYWNALVHRANREIRNELELPLGLIIKGKSDGEILQWIYKSGDAGREWRRRMKDRGYDTPEEVTGWINTTRDHVYAMYPSKEVRDIIINRPISIDEMKALMGNRPDLLDEVTGPNIKLADLNAADRFGARVGAVTDAAWKVLAGAETKLVRTPFFKILHKEELEILIKNARDTGADPTDYFVNSQLSEIAKRRALVRVEQTLYSSRRLTNGMYAARFLMSFPLAFFNSQAVALRLMAKNPINAYWYSTVQEAFDNFEAYEDREGNTYKNIKDVPEGTPVTVKFPLYNKTPDQIKAAMRPFIDPRGGGIRVNANQLNFMVADPSISWIGGSTLSSLVNTSFGKGTPWQIYGEDIVKGLRKTFGDDFFENSLLYGGYPEAGSNVIETTLNTILPGYQRSLLNALGVARDDRWYGEAYAMYRTMIDDWIKSGNVGEPPTLDQAYANQSNFSFIRAGVQFFSPLSISFNPVTQAAMQYYADVLEANKGDYDAADIQFKKEFGLNGFALLGSSYKNIAKLSASYDDIKVIRNNEKLLTKIGAYSPKYANMLSTQYGDELTTKYSTEIASIYKYLNYPGKGKSPIAQLKSDDDIQKEVDGKIGWILYNQLMQEREARMYELGIRSTSDPRYVSSGIQDDVKAREEEISNQYRGWQDQRDDDRANFWNKVFPAIEIAAKDPEWRKHADGVSSKWQEISTMVDAMKDFHAAYESSMSSAQKFDLAASFSQQYYDYLQTASDEFGTFAVRYFNSMPELNTQYVMRRTK